MSLLKNLQLRKARRTIRVRKSHVSRGTKLRISIFRSLSNIYAQVIDDAAHATVASFSSLQLKDVKGDKKQVAYQVGLQLGKMMQQKNLGEVFFDRGPYKYHGRVKALADGLRESGIAV